MTNKTLTLTYTDADDLMRQAQGIMYREYMESVARDGESIKDDLVSAIKAEELTDADAINEWLSDRVHETADSDAWVIYTHKAKLILLLSDNPDAAEDEGIDLKGDDYSGRAYYAYRADLQDWLSRNADVDEMLEEHAPKREDEDETEEQEA